MVQEWSPGRHGGKGAHLRSGISNGICCPFVVLSEMLTFLSIVKPMGVWDLKALVGTAIARLGCSKHRNLVYRFSQYHWNPPLTGLSIHPGAPVEVWLLYFVYGGDQAGWDGSEHTPLECICNISSNRNTMDLPWSQYSHLEDFKSSRYGLEAATSYCQLP